MARLTAKLRDQRGFTLPELLVAAMIGLIVAAGAGAFVVTLVKGQPRVSDRAAQIQDGRVMLERLSREIRQGDSITNATSTGLRVHTYVTGPDCAGTAGTRVPCWITYACSGTTCTRTPDGGTPETVVEGIGQSAVFCYSAWNGDSTCPATSAASPEYVALRLSFDGADGDESITLDNGIALRNAGGTT